MAYRRDILSADGVFFDTDMDLPGLPVYAGNPTQAQIDALDVTPVNATGWEMSFTVRAEADSDVPLIEKLSAGSPSAISVTGIFDADPAANTQAVVVHLDDTDTYDPDGGSPEVNVAAGKYVYALKRTDEGHETVIAHGTFRLLQSAAWE